MIIVNDAGSLIYDDEGFAERLQCRAEALRKYVTPVSELNWQSTSTEFMVKLDSIPDMK